MQFATLEAFEEETAQAQAQAQTQTQTQFQSQEENQVKVEISNDIEEEDEEPTNLSKMAIYVMVAVFFLISLTLESGDKNPIQKLLDALRNPQSLILIVLVAILYSSIRALKAFGKFTEEDYENFMTVERHANVAFIIVLFEAIGMRFTSYWIVWAVTYLHI
jgi:hypothetical protein